MSDNPFDKATGLPSISFAVDNPATGRKDPVPIGTRLGGKVTKAPEVVQARGYEGADKGKPLFWDNLGKGVKTSNQKDAQGNDNKPVQQIVINLMCPDGVERSLWTPYYPKSQYEAIQAALAGRAIEVGDELFVTITGFTPVPGKNPANDYSADFTKGQGAFAPPAGVPAPPVPAPPPPPAAVPAPPPPAAGPATTPEGFTLDGLLKGGWTHDQAIAAYPMLANGNGSTPAAVPAQVAASSDDARAAKLAAMSAEDRELLGLNN